MIKKYAKRYHEIDSHKITFIGSSATISNPLDFSTLFFDLENDKIALVPKDDETRSSYYSDEMSPELNHRYHLFMMPYSFRPVSTVSKSVGYLQDRHMNGTPPSPNLPKRETNNKPLQILGFVNNLSDSTNLIDATQREFMGDLGYIQVSGHTTDFDKDQRSKAEKGFNRQEMHVLFATPTLEVGVDFRMVNCIVIFGFPFSFNEYVQRIGRGGRKDNSLIITVCQSWKPIDHYFYSNAKRKISKQHQNMEPIPLTRNNPDAIRKHLRASVFDMISSWDNSEKFFEDLRLLDSELVENSDALIEGSMKILSLTEDQLEENRPSIKQFIQELKKDVNQATKLNRKESIYQRFFESATGYGDKYRLTDLRSTEPSIAVEISWDAVS